MPSTITLAQYAMLQKQPLSKGVALGIAQEGVIADIMSWRSLGGALSETGIRYDEVISPDWVPIDGTIATKSAQGKPLSFTVSKMAVHIDTPVELDDNNKDSVERVSVRNTKLAIKGAAYALNDAFINGDQGTDGNQMEGINKLVAQLDASQTIGSTQLDLTASYTDALAESLWSRLDEGFHACEGHKPSAAFANSTFLLKMRSLLRQNHLYGDNHNWVEHAFDIDDPRRSLRTAATRPAFVFQGVPFYDLGVKADQTTKVIGNTYTEGGSSAAGTRVFLVKFSEEDLEGIQAKPLSVDDIGMLEARDVRRKRLTWLPGLAVWGPRSIVKLQGIKVAS